MDKNHKPIGLDIHEEDLMNMESLEQFIMDTIKIQRLSPETFHIPKPKIHHLTRVQIEESMTDSAKEDTS